MKRRDDATRIAMQLFRRPDGSLMDRAEMETVLLNLVGTDMGGRTLRVHRNPRGGALEFFFGQRVPL